MPTRSGGMELFMKAYKEQGKHPDDQIACLFNQNNFSWPAHWHIHVEFVYVLNGEIKVGINENVKILSKGDIAFIASNDIHYYENVSSEDRVVIFMIHPSLIHFHAGWPVSIHLENQFFTDVPQNVRDVLSGIAQNYDAKEEYKQFLLKSNIYSLFAFVLEHGECSDINDTQHRKIIQRERIQTVINYIEENYSKDITLQDAAGVAYMHRNYFSSYFKIMCGMGFSRFLNITRVTAAEKLLKNTELTVIEIAFRCGFDCVRTFNRVFLDVKGATPTMFRNSLV